MGARRLVLRRTPRHWPGRVQTLSIQNFCILPNLSLLCFLCPLCLWRAPHSFCAPAHTPAPDKPLSAVAHRSGCRSGCAPHLVIKIPGSYMKDTSCCNNIPAAGADGSSVVNKAVHDIACVPDFPKNSTHPGQQREPGVMLLTSLSRQVFLVVHSCHSCLIHIACMRPWRLTMMMEGCDGPGDGKSVVSQHI